MTKDKEKKIKYCDNCKPRVGGLVYVDDVYKPVCSKCGRKIYDLDVNSKVRVGQTTLSKLQSEAVLELVKQFGETKLISRPDGTPEEKTFISKELEQFLSDQIQKAYLIGSKETISEVIIGLDNLFDRCKIGKEKTIKELKKNQQKWQGYLMGILASENIIEQLQEKI